MEEKTNKSDVFRQVYDDATYFVDSMIQEYEIFPGILSMMRDGNATIELRKRYMLRAIDETWVNMIEDTLPAIDVLIRNPSKYIEQREEVMAIELTRKISPKSLQHLAQHTNLISKIEGDEITPTKLLNVFNEETMQTYENKFLNTLINRLYSFVNRRYEIAKTAGQDEKTTSIEFKEDFDHNKVKVKMNFRVEISESAEDEDDRVERNYTYTTDLWRRVERLNSIVQTYANSEFVRNMGRSYIRPPVMRTNAILKNKNLHQCLLLWQFIETYESAGYSMLVQEDLEKVDEGYIKELYSTLALQYLIFRYNIHNEFDSDETLASNITDKTLSPRIIDELSKNVSEDEFNIEIEEKSVSAPAVERYATLSPEDMLMLEVLDVALDAADYIADHDDESMYSMGAINDPEAQTLSVSPDLPEDEYPGQESADEDNTAAVQSAAAQTLSPRPLRISPQQKRRIAISRRRR